MVCLLDSRCWRRFCAIAWLRILAALILCRRQEALFAFSYSLLLTNGTFYTVNDNGNNKASLWAQAVWIDDRGFLAAVGTNEEVLQLVLAEQHGPNTNASPTTLDTASSAAPANVVTVDLQQRLVLPGFQDAHLHVVEAGINAQLCYMDPDIFLPDIPYYFQECPNGGKAVDGGEWLLGAGIDVGILLEDIIFTNSGVPYPVDVLDELYPETPVLILDNLGHGAIANTVAMNRVGYFDNRTEDPPGGILVRKRPDQRLTGIVLENAQHALRNAAFPPNDPQLQQVAYQSLLDALVTLRQHGITTVSDAGGFYRQVAGRTETWRRAEDEGTLTVRASNALYIYPDDLPLEGGQLDDLMERYDNDPTALVRFNQAKIYVDGILALFTGALYEPYYESAPSDVMGDADLLGFEYFGDRETLLNVSRTLSNLGFQLHFHVTGDRGAGLALDAIAHAGTTSTSTASNSSGSSGNDSFSGPHRLTHLYLVNESDRPRFSQLDAIADFQLSPSSFDASYTDFMANSVIGAARASQLLPSLELYEAGATLTLSSDWDADVLSPISKIQTVLTRPDGRSFPNLESVIPLLTLNPAKLLQHDDKTGSIEVGKVADLVVLDKNIFELEDYEIHTANVLMTMLQGKAVYDPEGLLGEAIGEFPTSGVNGLRVPRFMPSSSRSIGTWILLATVGFVGSV